MKNLLILLAVLFLSSVESIAQSVPEGMRFQAIARDLDGNLLSKKPIIVQVELLSNAQSETIHYSETHSVSSSDLGLIDFIIGEGAAAGKFSSIPWTKNEIWVRISVKQEGEKDFQIVSSGQLYSVPYAQYATSAGSLIGDDHESGHNGSEGHRTPGIGSNSPNWSLEGNYNSQERNDGNPVLGTTDLNHLKIVTNNAARIIIGENGQITFFTDIDLNTNLNVDGTTTLNGSLDVTGMNPTHLTGTLTVDKPTTLNDDLMVTGMNPTLLTGSLDVDKTLNVDQATTLNSSLDVTGMSPTHLTGSLTVDKTTQLNDAVTVANMASTHLTGSLDVDKTLNVDGAITLNSSLGVTGASPTHLSGALTVDGVTTLKDDLSVTGMNPTHLTGSLDVDKTLNADGATTMNNTLDVTGMNATTLSGMLAVSKETTLNDDLTVANIASTYLTGDLTVDGSANTGAVTLDGALEVSGMNPTELTGTLLVDKLSTLESGLVVKGGGAVGPNDEHLAFFDNTEGGSSDGIAIKINKTDPNKDNNYMTFYQGTSGSVTGRIESYSLGDLAAVPVPTSDEIWTAVCLGLADYNPITIAWTHMASAFNLFGAGWNATTIPAFDIPDIPAFNIYDVPALEIPDVPAFVIEDMPGFVIDDIPSVETPDIEELSIGPYLCATVCFCDCCFLCFDFTCCCESVCVIPEMTLFPAIDIPDFPGIAIPDFPGIPIPDFPGIGIPDFPGIAIPDFPGLVIPEVPELDLSVVVGEVPSIPTFNDILVQEGVCPNEDIFDLNDGYFARLVSWAIENRLTSLVGLDPVKLAGNALAWGIETAILNGGTVYGSKGADYAEYLPKMYPTEQFLKGELVGVHNGKISKNTTDADQILAITSQPIVLGNMPEDDNTADFEKVAFLGQVPVYVNGPVRMGDYIIPSGKNNGVANAVSSDEVTADMLSLVLGTAWSEYAGEGVTLINTSIGLRPMEIAEVLKKQGRLEDDLQQKILVQRNNSELLTNDIEQIKIALGLSATTYNP